MKHLFLATGLFAAFATGHGLAQTAVTEATIPFTFEAGKLAFPAGQYRVSETNGVVRIQSREGAHSTFLQGTPLSTYSRAGQYSLRFHVYGDKYYLSEVWSGTTGRRFPMTKEERLTAASFKPGQPRTDTVAMNRQPK